MKKFISLLFLLFPLISYSQGWIQVYNPQIGTQISITKARHHDYIPYLFFTTSGLTGAPFIGCNDTNAFNTYILNPANGTIQKPFGNFLKAYKCYDSPGEQCIFYPVVDYNYSKEITNFAIRYRNIGPDYCNLIPVRTIDYTTNGGTSYSTVFSNINTFTGFEYNYINPSIIFCIVNDTLFRTVNGGSLWYPMGRYPKVHAIKSLPASNLLLFDTLGILNSINNGETFERVYNLYINNPIYIYSSDNIYGITNDRHTLLCSTNLGIGWSQIYNNSDIIMNDLTIKTNSSDVMYLATNKGVWKSNNYGYNFSCYNNTYPTSKNILSITCCAGDSIYAVTSKGIFKTYQTFVNMQSNENPISGYELYNVYPNPFNSNTIIRYFLSEPKNAQIEIFNTAGKPVKTFSIYGNSGENQIMWNTESMASGIYFIRFKVYGINHSIIFTATQKAILLK